VFSDDIVNHQVKTPDLNVRSVTTNRIAPNAVNSARVADGTLTGKDVADGSLGSTDIGENSITEGKVVDGSLTDSDIASETLTGNNVRDGFLTGADIGDNSLTGADVSESTLGQVPASTLGGLGRSAAQNTKCDPENAGFATCVSVTLDLPAPTRVALFGRVTGQNENTADSGHGVCRLGNSITGGIAASQVHVDALNATASGEQFPVGGATALTAITPTLGPGTVSFGIDCNQFPAGAIFYTDANITAVAISPG
jgi:hypothetical protein